MRRLPFFLSLALLIFGTSRIAEGQTAPDLLVTSIPTYDIGGRTVLIPAPDGFTEVLSRYKRFGQRFSGTESPELEILAVHVRDSLIPRIAKREDPDLDLFTKASVSRSAKTLDMTPETFGAVVANLEKNFDSYLDPNGPTVTAMIKNADKGLDRYWKQESGLNITQPKSLGFFQKQPGLFSAMMASNIEVLENKRAMLTSISLLNLNGRLIFVYAYKVFTAEADIALLRDFTIKWTAGIITANKRI